MDFAFPTSPQPSPPQWGGEGVRAPALNSPSPPFRGERAGVRWVAPLEGISA
jgi:hypothetical protein